MRDYWHQNKIIFNNKLITYVNSSRKGDRSNSSCPTSSISMNQNTEKHPNYWDVPSPTAKWMMNAKPDIGVIIENNGRYTLSFIECKYLSNEDRYKKCTTLLTQTELQGKILDFICNNLKSKYNNHCLQKGQVRLVRFSNNNKNNVSDGEIIVPINTLLA